MFTPNKHTFKRDCNRKQANILHLINVSHVSLYHATINVSHVSLDLKPKKKLKMCLIIIITKACHSKSPPSNHKHIKDGLQYSTKHTDSLAIYTAIHNHHNHGVMAGRPIMYTLTTGRSLVLHGWGSYQRPQSSGQLSIRHGSIRHGCIRHGCIRHGRIRHECIRHVPHQAWVHQAWVHQAAGLGASGMGAVVAAEVCCWHTPSGCQRLLPTLLLPQPHLPSAPAAAAAACRTRMQHGSTHAPDQ